MVNATFEPTPLLNGAKTEEQEEDDDDNVPPMILLGLRNSSKTDIGGSSPEMPYGTTHTPLEDKHIKPNAFEEADKKRRG